MVTEQGVGETVQFARFLPLAALRCGRLLVVCPEDLRALLAAVPRVAEVRGMEEPPGPEGDAWVPLLSLPYVLGTTQAPVPYLDVAALRQQKGPTALPQLSSGSGLRVGIVWAGSPMPPAAQHRACPLAAWAPVLQTPGVTFVSLQQGEWPGELAQVPAAQPLVNPIPGRQDVAALALAELDLLLSVDSAAAQVAGALGKPGWVLLGAVPEWRWGLAGETTPWYPTLRLVRQRRPGDWEEVMTRVARELTAWQRP